MPKIKINDQAGVEILTAESGPGSGISKYFKDDTAGFIASAEVARALNKPIATLGGDPIGAGLNFATSGAFGTSGVEWKVTAGAKLTVQATQAGGEIPTDTVFENPCKAPDGRTFLGVSFSPTLSASASLASADLKFGFSAGGSVTFTAGRSFDEGSSPALGKALRNLIETAVVPGNALDVRQMQEGDYGSVSGSGKFGFSASFDVARAMNPLALPQLPLNLLGNIDLQAGASLTVGAKVDVSGLYQIRVVKLAGQKALVGLYKKSGTQFRFDVEAKAGAELNLGQTEMLAKLMGMMGAVKADVQSLVDSGLSDKQIDNLKAAIEASLNRSIAVSLTGSFAASRENSRIFEYEFDLDRLGANGLDALNSALRADFAPLTAHPVAELPQGVRLVASVVDDVRKESITWKLNFIGLVNVLRLSELVRHGKALFNAGTGELVVTDEVRAKELAVTSFPLAADARKLQHLMLQSFIVTAAYCASGTQKLSGQLSGTLTYFDQIANANRSNIGNYLDNLTGAELMTDQERTDFLALGPFGGRCSVFLEATFDNARFEAMFFDANGDPRPRESYDFIGRDCISRIVRAGDDSDYRRRPMLPRDGVSNALWAGMVDKGASSLHTVLPPELNSGIPLGVLTNDYITVRWWSEAMSGASVESLR